MTASDFNPPKMSAVKITVKDTMMIIPSFQIKKDGSFRQGIKEYINKFRNNSLTEEEKTYCEDRLGLFFISVSAKEESVTTPLRMVG